MDQATRKPLFTLSGNRIGSKAQRYFSAQPSFCADHGLPKPITKRLPVAWEVEQVMTYSANY